MLMFTFVWGSFSSILTKDMLRGREGRKWGERDTDINSLPSVCVLTRDGSGHLWMNRTVLNQLSHWLGGNPVTQWGTQVP